MDPYKRHDANSQWHGSVSLSSFFIELQATSKLNRFQALAVATGFFAPSPGEQYRFLGVAEPSKILRYSREMDAILL